MPRILVVDDEEQIRQILEKFLTKMNYEVLTAAGGLEALEIIEKEDAIDVMILDMKMQEVSGADVLRELKHSKKNIPVILLSGSLGKTENIAALGELGFDEKDIVYKPIDLYVILDLVKKIVARKEG